MASRMKNGKKWLLVLALAVVGLVVLAGCDNPFASLTGGGASASASSDSGDVVQLADDTAVPSDGIITAAQFRSIQGKDRTVTFTGKASDGSTYVWTFNGKNIKNPQDQNLKVDIATSDDTLNTVKSSANSAPYGLAIKLSQKNGLITVPQLTIKTADKWDANSAVFLKYANGTLSKLSNVTFDNGVTNQSVMTFNVTESGDTYYLVAGNSGTGVTNADGSVTNADGTTTKSDGTVVASDGTVVSSGSGTSSGSGNTCTISINCSTLLSHLDTMDQSKREFVPSDGWILKPTVVSFTSGQSVHDVLQKVCQDNGIQMDSTFSAVYNSAYVRGINQLYEFNGGELSGWMYNVNGWFPNYGCSQYAVKSGDIINWVYTCDLGKDVGDNSQW